MRLDRGNNTDPNNLDVEVVQTLPQLTLPTRWEHLEPKIVNIAVPIRTIIQHVTQAMNVIREIVEYIRTTSGCQVLIMRADTGSGKTTFLNTLPHYMQDIAFQIQTIDLQTLDETEFGKKLWNVSLSDKAVNLIVLEGREKPESITDKYIQIALANINRFSREKRG